MNEAWLPLIVGPVSMVVPGTEVSTVKVRLAGVGSVLAARSIARTSNVCAPSLSDAVVNGEVQSANGSESTRHSNVPPVSSEENSNVGVSSGVSPDGPALIVVSGSPVSTVKVNEAGVGSVLLAVSMARTWKVCSPSASSAASNGELQEAYAPPSTRHWKVASRSGELNSNRGVESFVN